MNGFESVLALLHNAYRTLTEPAGYGIATWFLIEMFVWSGIAKLRKPIVAAIAMVDFGVIRHAQPFYGRVLGLIELGLAGALALGEMPVQFLALAASLLWLFVVLISRSLWDGKHFPCACFGETESKLSGWSLARTTALAVLTSLLVLTTPPPGHVGLHDTDLLQAVAALALLGSIVLLETVPRLLTWNNRPLEIRLAHSAEVQR